MALACSPLAVPPHRRRAHRAHLPRRSGGSNVSKMIETHDIPRTGTPAGSPAAAPDTTMARPQLAAALTALFGPVEGGAPELSGYIIATG
jgi:hypothetical protein